MTKPKLGRPIDAEGDVTRARILRAARTAFGELGYAATTYRLLAGQTGLAPSALYNYFSSKAELYAAVHADVQLENYAGSVLPAISDTETFVERVDQLLGSFVAMNDEVPEAARFQAAARTDTSRHEELASLGKTLPTQRRQMFAEMVDLGISTGELAADRRAEVLAMLETLTVGLIEVSSEPELHRAAVSGFRRAVAALVDPD
ncbi:TetR/AcrR family transcriptional regulator [bacterium]|nr:TetR/AcrR family transcriptional regulator [bacterium]